MNAYDWQIFQHDLALFTCHMMAGWGVDFRISEDRTVLRVKVDNPGDKWQPTMEATEAIQIPVAAANVLMMGVPLQNLQEAVLAANKLISSEYHRTSPAVWHELEGSELVVHCDRRGLRVAIFEAVKLLQSTTDAERQAIVVYMAPFMLKVLQDRFDCTFDEKRLAGCMIREASVIMPNEIVFTTVFQENSAEQERVTIRIPWEHEMASA